MFDHARTVTRVDTQTFTAQADETWMQGRGQFGGLVSAWLVGAFDQAVGDPTRTPRTFTAHLAAPVPPGPVQLHVEVVRAGKYVTQLRGELRSDDQVCVTALGTWARDRAEGPEISPPPAPQLPPYHTLPELPPSRLLPVFTQHVDYRFGFRGVPYSGAQEATLGGWARFRQGAEPDAAMLAGLLDVWPPAVLVTLDRPRPAATVDLTLHFLQPFRPQAQRDDLYGMRLHSAWGHAGYMEEHGDLWDASGRILARMRQWRVVM